MIIRGCCYRLGGEVPMLLLLIEEDFDFFHQKRLLQLSMFLFLIYVRVYNII